MAESNCGLRCFCNECDTAIHAQAAGPPARDNPDKLEEIITAMGRLMEKLCNIEDRMDGKADVQHLAAVEAKVKTVEGKLDNMEQEIKEMKQNKRSEESTVIDCVEKVILARTKDSIEEEAEKARRKTNVIVHGLPEFRALEASEREEDDFGLVASMLHEMKCDDVETAQTDRLGRRPEANDEAGTHKPRPLKIVLKSEEQKIHVLTSAKNMRLIKDGDWKNVFLHADLTMKEREIRRQLVSEMKERKQQGESDLIIVNWSLFICCCELE